MKVKYKILYKNGFEEDITHDFNSEEGLCKVNESITKAFQDDLRGVLTFGDQISKGIYIRISDVSRVTIEVL